MKLLGTSCKEILIKRPSNFYWNCNFSLLFSLLTHFALIFFAVWSVSLACEQSEKTHIFAYFRFKRIWAAHPTLHISAPTVSYKTPQKETIIEVCCLHPYTYRICDTLAKKVYNIYTIRKYMRPKIHLPMDNANVNDLWLLRWTSTTVCMDCLYTVYILYNKYNSTLCGVWGMDRYGGRGVQYFNTMCSQIPMICKYK